MEENHGETGLEGIKKTSPTLFSDPSIVWLNKLQNEFNLTPEILVKSQNLQLVYQRFKILTGRKALISHVLNSYCQPNHDPTLAPWLFGPFIPAVQKEFDEQLKDISKGIKMCWLDLAAFVCNAEFAILLIEKMGLTPSQTTLRHAANYGNLDLVKYLADTLIPCQDTLKPNQDTLDSAFISRNIGLAKWLIEEYELTPDLITLKGAAYNCDIDVVKMLINDYEITPDQKTLNKAAASGDIKKVKWLLTDQKLEPNYLTPRKAVESRNVELVKYLNTEHNLTSFREELDIAANSGCIEMVKLICGDISPHFVKPTIGALNCVVKSGNIELVRWLTTEYTSLIPDWNALKYATDSGNPYMVIMLMTTANHITEEVVKQILDKPKMCDMYRSNWGGANQPPRVFTWVEELYSEHLNNIGNAQGVEPMVKQGKK